MFQLYLSWSLSLYLLTAVQCGNSERGEKEGKKNPEVELKEKGFVEDVTDIRKEYPLFRSNFVELENGIVYDRITKLLWLKDAHYFKNRKMTWENANKFCNSMKIGGFAGWRLPNEHELTRMFTVYHNKEVHPFINIQDGYYRTGIGNCHRDSSYPNVCVSLKRRDDSCCGKSDGCLYWPVRGSE